MAWNNPKDSRQSLFTEVCSWSVNSFPGDLL